MKKRILILLMMLVLSITGCTKEASEEKLNEINNKIISYFSSSHAEYTNLSFNYVDKENKKVVVGLIENTEKQQARFRKKVIDSDLITFTEGKVLTSTDYHNFQTQDCLEWRVLAYIYGQEPLPREEALNNLVDVDMNKVEYSKVRINQSGYLFAILKTSDYDTISKVESYFKNTYPGYQRINFSTDYYIFVYNGDSTSDFAEAITQCYDISSK